MTSIQFPETVHFKSIDLPKNVPMTTNLNNQEKFAFLLEEKPRQHEQCIQIEVQQPVTFIKCSQN